MSKPKHTPGPWIVDTYHDSMFKISKPDFKPGDEVIHRLEADRRLIAAAPDTFDALEDVCNGLQHAMNLILELAPHKEALVKNYQKRLDRADKAIAKAAGGQDE